MLDLGAVVADMREMLGRLIGEDIAIVLDPDAAPAWVLADRAQIEQVVLNLAVNARDAMPTGGTMSIKTATVELDEAYGARHVGVKPGHYVALTVTDTGTGIPAEVQARMFEPFFTTKEAGKGTGLGLATIHGIATRFGGSVNVYSEMGRGSAFKVYLPCAAPPAARTEATPAPARVWRGTQSVLVVEDEEGLRKLIKRLLVRQGYTVLTAGNAAEARALVDRTPQIDVLLTDVVMPGASGPALTAALVAERPDLKVVYMSGYNEETIINHGEVSPGIAFLHKPFTADALGAKLREVLDR